MLHDASSPRKLKISLRFFQKHTRRDRRSDPCSKAAPRASRSWGSKRSRRLRLSESILGYFLLEFLRSWCVFVQYPSVHRQADEIALVETSAASQSTSRSALSSKVTLAVICQGMADFRCPQLRERTTRYRLPTPLFPLQIPGLVPECDFFISSRLD